MKKLIVIVVLLGALAAVALMMKPSEKGETKNDFVAPADWETLEGDGLTFAYPVDLGSSYIASEIWPPLGYILSTTGPLPCAKGDTQAGAMTYREINGTAYCITETSAEKSGGTEKQYAYAFESRDSIVALIMSIRYLPCAKMEAERKTACETEQKAFNIDPIVDGIASTFKLGTIEEAPDMTVVPVGA